MCLSKCVNSYENRLRSRLQDVPDSMTSPEIDAVIENGRKRFFKVVKLCGNAANDMAVYAMCLESKLEAKDIANFVKKYSSKSIYRSLGKYASKTLVGNMIADGDTPLCESHHKRTYSGGSSAEDKYKYKFEDTFLYRYLKKFGVDTTAMKTSKGVFGARDVKEYDCRNDMSIVGKDKVEVGSSLLAQLVLGLMLCDQDLVANVLKDGYARRYLFSISPEALLTSRSDYINEPGHYTRRGIKLVDVLRDFYTLVLKEARLYTNANECVISDATEYELRYLDDDAYSYTRLALATRLYKFRNADDYDSKDSFDDTAALENMLDAMYDAGLVFNNLSTGDYNYAFIAENAPYMEQVVDCIDMFLEGLCGDVPSSGDYETLTNDLFKNSQEYDVQINEDGDHACFIPIGRKYVSEFSDFNTHQIEIDREALVKVLAKTIVES